MSSEIQIPEDLQEELVQIKKTIYAYQGQYELHYEEKIDLRAALKRKAEIERIAHLEAQIADLEESLTARDAKFEGCPHFHESYDKVCACSFDRPTDVCAVHAPQLRKAEAQNKTLAEALNNLVEYTDKIIPEWAKNVRHAHKQARAALAQYRDGVKG